MPTWASEPFLSYSTGFTPSNMREAFRRLDDFILDNGPFDGVVGFSHGAAIAISYILHQQRIKPDEKPAFCFATLFSPIFAASSDDACYEELVNRLLDDEHELFRSAFSHTGFEPSLYSEDEQTFIGYIRVLLSMDSILGTRSRERNVNLEFFNVAGGTKAEHVPRLLHPALTRDRVHIPTVVVTGENDLSTIIEQSRIAHGLCKASLQWNYWHDGGHDVPFKRPHVENIASYMMKAAEMGRELGSLYDL